MRMDKEKGTGINHVDAVTYLLAVLLIAVGCKEKPAEIETATRKKLTPTTNLLCQAARLGDIDKIKSFISSGVDVNVKDKYDSTPLHYAAEHGHKNVAGLLVANGADLTAKDEYGNTPFHDAARLGRYNVVALLVAGGANPDTKNNGGQTPLDCAIALGREDVVELLKAAGAEAGVKNAPKHGPKE